MANTLGITCVNARTGGPSLEQHGLTIWHGRREYWLKDHQVVIYDQDSDWSTSILPSGPTDRLYHAGNTPSRTETLTGFRGLTLPGNGSDRLVLFREREISGLAAP